MLNNILIKPHITEKASKRESNVYSFVVSPRATKSQVIKAVSEQYKVKALGVRMINVVGKAVTRGGKQGRTGAFKKAYVKLPAGQKIELV